MRVSSDWYEDGGSSEAITGKQALILVAWDAKNNVVALCSDNKDFCVWRRCDVGMTAVWMTRVFPIRLSR
ncbi:hypothetical protein [Pigmentiphaga litoralis]|uniref:Uncharacterized protein n=1 Tax=Pigmentiphaga litoralis TaxID=516702 RepID=A0A7Y9IS12_9BURK|nr:hypothetical protein [Pigmentiphaga litoralis]NYE24447.1 hypothetical protein [Pigmentiphaga litoralis]NYE81939.1 hypothetical protein [Pigmentiphaga litoralis]